MFKGKKMAGHMGQDNVTTLNLTVFRVDVERGLILIKGAVPGTEGGFVKIRDAVKKAAAEGPADAGRHQADAPAQRRRGAAAERPRRPKPRPGAKTNEDRRDQARRRQGRLRSSSRTTSSASRRSAATSCSAASPGSSPSAAPAPTRSRPATRVSRTGKKMYRQKGTGGARHGSRRARPVRRRRQGARAGGAQPRVRPAEEGPRAGAAARAVVQGQGRRRWWCWTAATLDDAEDRRPARRLRQDRASRTPW